MNPELNRLMYRLSEDEGYVVNRLGDHGLFCVGDREDDILVITRPKDSHVYYAHSSQDGTLAAEVECAVAVGEIEHWLDYERDQV